MIDKATGWMTTGQYFFFGVMALAAVLWVGTMILGLARKAHHG